MKAPLGLISICLATVFTTNAAVSKLSAYYVGNSLTDNTKYSGVAASAKLAGVAYTYGRHSIPGAPLEWLWDHRTEGFCEPSCPPTALPTIAWDALSLQVGQRGIEEDSSAACSYVGLAKQGNANVQPYIYAVWPNKSWGDYATLWAKPFTGGSTWATKDYFNKLIAALRKAKPSNKTFLLVPSGHVMAELDLRAKAGQLPGVTDIYSWYEDDCHLNKIGAYVTGCTMFATLCKADPRGLAVPADYAPISAPLAAAIQDAVWKTITSMGDLTGVTATYVSNNSIPTVGGTVAPVTAAVRYTLMGRKASRTDRTTGAILERTSAGNLRMTSSMMR